MKWSNPERKLGAYDDDVAVWVLITSGHPASEQIPGAVLVLMFVSGEMGGAKINCENKALFSLSHTNAAGFIAAF